MRVHQSVRRRIILALIALAAAALFWRFAELRDSFVRLASGLEDAVRDNGASSAAAFVILAALSAMISPFSSAPLVPVAAAIWGNLPTFVMLLIGWMLGAAAAYAVGRFAGHPFLRLLSPWKRIERWKSEMPERHAFALGLITRLALPSEIGYAYGAVRFGFLKYLIVTFVAELPASLILVHASGAIVAGRPLAVLPSVAALVLLTAAAAYFLARHRRH